MRFLLYLFNLGFSLLFLVSSLCILFFQFINEIICGYTGNEIFLLLCFRVNNCIDYTVGLVDLGDRGVLIVCDWDVTWWFINCRLVEFNWGWLILCWIDRLNLLYIRLRHYAQLLTLPQHTYHYNHKEYYSSNVCSVHINYPCYEF